MAKFTRKVEFDAYQFVPENVTSEYGEGSIDDIIEAALPNVELNNAFITPPKLDMFKELKPGFLTLNIYDYDNEVSGKEKFVLYPGDWIYDRRGGYRVVSDEEFRKMGFESA